MRLPAGSLLLAFAVLGVYFYFSGGSLYLSDEVVSVLSLRASEPLYGIASHLFIHVGARHLLGNVVPLILFALVFETVATAFDVAAVFFLSGVVASILFSLINPALALVGASAGVSGLMGAATLVRPRLSIALLFAAPLLTYLLVFPALDAGLQLQKQSLAAREQQLQTQVQQLIGENKSAEAAQAAAALEQASEKQQMLSQGAERESRAQSDFLVHIFGALSGLAYIMLFRKDLLKGGSKEFFSVIKQAKNLRAVFSRRKSKQ